MSKSKTERVATAAATAAVKALEGDSVEILDEDDAEQQNPDLLAALSELEGADDIDWNVFRTHPKDQEGFVDKISTSQIRLDRFRDEYGAGTYRIKGTLNGRFVKQVTVRIAGLPKKIGDVVRQDNTQDIYQILAAEREKSQQRTLAMIAALAPFLGPALANLFGGNKGASVTELVAALGGLKALAPDKPERDPLELVMKGLELANTMKGGEGGAETNWLDVVRDGLKEVVPALANLKQPQAPTPGATPSLPAPAANSNNANKGATTQPAPQPSGDNMLLWMRGQLDKLIDKAKHDKDPELWAEVMLDEAPPGIDVAKLRGYLAREDWWTILQQFHAGVAPYEGWFTELRDILLEQMQAIIDEQSRPIDDAAKTGETKNEHTSEQSAD